MGWSGADRLQAVQHLKCQDEVLRGVIERVGPLRLKSAGKGYSVLVQSIISQQISTAAAATIGQRLRLLVAGGELTAEAVAELSDEQLKAVGISPQKLSYLRDLTRCTLEGVISFRRISRASDEAAIEELIQVRGIGRWTAQMYLIFSLGRPDVFAPDDLGLRNAMQRLYGLGEKAGRPELERLAERWRPWRSAASWYLWRSL
ncbi:MAG: DNA-3-methyladenine glycosylase [Planctomyces sp.]|jgi:DNA-3-methyladenine glycosylase II|nr:DNA-3-methyladenine glycosylase [Planctomyces sp.]